MSKTIHLGKVLVALIIVVTVGCKKDEPGNGTGGTTGTSYRFEGFETCDVIAPPADVNLSSYYSKFTNCDGIPVIGNAEVPDEAFDVAHQTMAFMLQGQNGVKNKLIERGEYYILVAPGDNPRDVPEFANVTGTVNSGIYWDQTRCAASNAGGLLCMVDVEPWDGHNNVFVHEFAHMIDVSGLRLIDPDFENQLNSAYAAAQASGAWDNTYAMTNKTEYFAVCVQIYFEVGYPFVEGPGDGNWNGIVTRADLQQADPTIYNLIASKFQSGLNVPGCIQGEDLYPWEDPNLNCGTTVTDIDGNAYNVVRIGNQCWLDKNLTTTRFKNGTSIQNIPDDSDWANASSPGWCNFENSSSNGNTHGKLYNWSAIGNSAGICPDGWHVATKDEWQTLIQYSASLGSGTAGALKSLNLWDAPNDGATNETGFNAIPAGLREDVGTFHDLTHRAVFWTSTQDGSNQAYSFQMWSNGDFTQEVSYDKKKGHSCRCVKDQ